MNVYPITKMEEILGRKIDDWEWEYPEADVVGAFWQVFNDIEDEAERFDLLSDTLGDIWNMGKYN